MHRCGETDGWLNFHKWVWRYSSSIPMSMSASTFSMSVFTYNTLISTELICVFMSMEKLICGLILFFVFSSFFPSIVFPSTEPTCALTVLSVTLTVLSSSQKLQIHFCSTGRCCSSRKQRVEVGDRELTRA